MSAIISLYCTTSQSLSDTSSILTRRLSHCELWIVGYIACGGDDGDVNNMQQE